MATHDRRSRLDSPLPFFLAAMERGSSVRALNVRRTRSKEQEKAYKEAAKQRSKALLDRVNGLFKEHWEQPHPLDFPNGPLPAKLLDAQVKLLRPLVAGAQDLEAWRARLGEWRARCEVLKLEPAGILTLLKQHKPETSGETFAAAVEDIVKGLDEAAR